jgi:hypothetical protein
VIIRKVPNPRGWTTTPNAIWDDNRISYRARGILGWLLSRPEGWETDMVKMSKLGVQAPTDGSEDGREGRLAVRTAMKELEHFGYLWRPRTQDERGRWRTDVFVYDEPTAQPGQLSRFPDRPHGDNPVGKSVEGSVDRSADSPHRVPEKRPSEDRPLLTKTKNHRYPITQRDHRGRIVGPVDKSEMESLTLSSSDRRAVQSGAALYPDVNMLALRARLVADGLVDDDWDLGVLLTLLSAAAAVLASTTGEALDNAGAATFVVGALLTRESPA